LSKTLKKVPLLCLVQELFLLKRHYLKQNVFALHTILIQIFTLADYLSLSHIQESSSSKGNKIQEITLSLSLPLSTNNFCIYLVCFRNKLSLHVFMIDIKKYNLFVVKNEIS